ncbi:hypothetical protein BDW68DRAFT_172397 [Aspergillus falconensis]
MSSIEKSSREQWTKEDDQRLVSLRYQYDKLTWEKFTQQFFPRRSRAAVSWRWGILTRTENNPASLPGPSASYRRRGPRPGRGRRGGLTFASRQSVRRYRPRQVSDTTEDDDNCSWDSRESHGDESVEGAAEEGRGDVVREKGDGTSVAQMPQAKSTKLRRPREPQAALNEHCQSINESESPHAAYRPPMQQFTDLLEEPGASVVRPEAASSHPHTGLGPAVTTAQVKWQLDNHAAAASDGAHVSQRATSGSASGSMAPTAGKTAASSPALYPAASKMPRLSEAVRPYEAAMDKIIAENLSLRRELRELQTALDEVVSERDEAVSERDQLRENCRVLKELEDKGAFQLLARLVRH